MVPFFKGAKVSNRCTLENMEQDQPYVRLRQLRHFRNISTAIGRRNAPMNHAMLGFSTVHCLFEQNQK